MKIILVRHGQSKDNVTRTISGHGTTTLTDLGKEQAQALGVIIVVVAVICRSRSPGATSGPSEYTGKKSIIKNQGTRYLHLYQDRKP